MGLLSGITDALGLTGDKETKTNQTVNTWTPKQRKTSDAIGDCVLPKIGQGATPYGGQRVAGMSSPEQKSQQWLTNYMGQKTPQQFDWANTGLKNTMQGNYSNPVVDPEQTRKLYSWAQGQALNPLQNAQSKDIINDASTDQLFSRIKDQTLRELPDIQKTLADNANLSGMYFSGGHNQIQGDLLKDTQGKLLDTLANLKYSDETQRRDLERTREGRTYDTLRDVLGTGYGQQYGDIQTGQGVGSCMVRLPARTLYFLFTFALSLKGRYASVTCQLQRLVNGILYLAFLSR